MARIAGLNPSAVICEIMNDDGTMARMPELEKFAAKHDLKIISVADLVRYRIQKETLVRASSKPIADRLRNFRAAVYENIINGETHVAMTLGDFRRQPNRFWCASKPRILRLRCSARSSAKHRRAINSSLKK
jgi:3,4-dihydroxy 2-butanone 4-phosphate synthase/GTP cyclohydrolase II